MAVNLTDALDRLAELVDPDAFPTLSETDLQAALDASLIPDTAGVWPGQPGYQPTYDLYWAAAETSTLRAMRAAMSATQTVTKVTSEGSTFEVEQSAPDWAALGRRWRAVSQIGRETGFGDSLSVIEVVSPDSGFVPASQALRDGTVTWT